LEELPAFFLDEVSGVAKSFAGLEFRGKRVLLFRASTSRRAGRRLMDLMEE